MSFTDPDEKPADAAASSTPSHATDVRNLVLVVALGILPLVVAVFLVAGGFLSSWDGKVAAVRPTTVSDDPQWYEVLVVDDAGATSTQTWPADVVRQMKVPIDNLLLAPATLPDDAPITSKHRFNLYYLVTVKDGTNRSIPTTSPGAFALAVLTGLIAFAARNAWVAGSPIALFPPEEETDDLEHEQIAAASANVHLPPMPAIEDPLAPKAAPGAAPARPKFRPPPPKGRAKKRRNR
jgi:hypothetical protein